MVYLMLLWTAVVVVLLLLATIVCLGASKPADASITFI
jgi:hypothetical protein